MKWELMYEFELRRVRNAKQSDELMVGVHFWHTLLRFGYKARWQCSIQNANSQIPHGASINRRSEMSNPWIIYLSIIIIIIIINT